jgi:O-antigen ligase
MFQKKIISFLSNWNLVLMIAGYSFFTTLLFPIIGNVEVSSRLITLPYRSIILGVSLLLILYTIKQKKFYPLEVKLVILFFIFHFIRFFFDLELRDDFFNTDAKILYYTFLIFVSFIPFYATISSLKHIDFTKVALYSLILLSITMLLSIVLDSGEQEFDRLSGNVGLNPISYGQVGAFGIVLSFYFLWNKQKKSIFFNIFLILSIILGFVTLGRAASRGPLLALVLCWLFYIFSKQKKPLISIVILVVIFLLIYILQDFLISAVGAISPTLETRILASLQDGDSSGRDELYQQGWQQFIDNPVLGSYFVLEPESGKGINSHNIIIDALMSFGLFGGLLIIYLIIKSLFFASKLVKNRQLIWVAQFLVIIIIGSMVSSSFYMDALLPIFMAVVFMYFKERKQFINYSN